jgi:tetratricopeptide (TPR) repeat protein
MSEAHDRIARALDAVQASLDDPRQCRDAAQALIAEDAHDEAAAIAYRALGLAQRHAGDISAAIRSMRIAISGALRSGFAYRAAEARMSLVVLLSDRGETESALRQADLAMPVLKGVDAARLQVNLGLVLLRTGRTSEALSCFQGALPALRRADDLYWEALLLNLRGTLYAYQGEHRAATADLLRCVELSQQGHYAGQHAIALGNLGYTLMRAGDIPGALAHLDEAVDMVNSLGRQSAGVLMDKAEALLMAGLAHEARDAAGSVVAMAAKVGFAYDQADARLVMAKAALADGDPAAAMEAAHDARLAFSRQRRRLWSIHANAVELSARFALGQRSAALLRAATQNSDQLESLGWTTWTQRSRLQAALIAIDLNRTAQADALLGAVAASRSRGPAETRATGWHAEALRRLLSDDRTGANRALRRGLRIVQENAATLGATDLRAHAAAHGADLAILGTKLAVEHGTPRSVLDWSEAWRAAALRQRPVRPPNDEEISLALAELRRVVDEIGKAGNEGRNASHLRRERLRLEEVIRDRSRHARGSYAPEQDLDLRALASGLGDRALVEYIRLDDRLLAVTMTDGRCRLHELGSYTQTLDELEALRFALHRDARRFGSPRVQEATRAALEHGSKTLDDQLFGVLRHSIDDRDLVVVPTGTLHALPWPMLPSCADRAVTVSPSARAWLRALQQQAPNDPRQVLVAGPRLYHAETEIAELAARYPDATHLAGDAASVAAVSTAIDGADLVHIAAHGHFRADNPQFSCLDLADGPLTVYDLERLDQAPRRLVLSACDAALSGIRPGDELMGLASAVFALGTSTLIASVVPVDDIDSQRLMLDLHNRLATGTSPATALSQATTNTGVTGFVCFGNG